MQLISTSGSTCIRHKY